MTARFIKSLTASLIVAFVMVGCMVQSAGPRHFAVSDHVSAGRSSSVSSSAGHTAFIPGAGSEVTLRGTATIGAWSAQSSDPDAQVDLPTQLAAIDSAFERLARAPRAGLPLFDVRLADVNATVRVSVPVKSLKGDSPGMERDMRASLKANEFPTISFVLNQLSSIEPAGGADAHGQPGLRIRGVGDLTVAGATRRTLIEATVTHNAAGIFAAHAQVTLSMSDFGITPPTALFGLIKAGNTITVAFDLNFEPTGAAENASTDRNARTSQRG